MAQREKHQHEIINYKRRSQAGKTIGSGRAEKGVDLAVGFRQKNKGMSWSRLSSRALSLLKVAERERSVAAVVVLRSSCLVNGYFTGGNNLVLT